MEKWEHLVPATVPSNWPNDGYKPKAAWMNDTYQVWVYPDVESQLLLDEGDKLRVTHLSIKRHDREPCNDWRHFQFIKNQLCGHEAEAIQIYPAESRLVDGSNQYHLWVMPKGFTLPFGFFDGRTISEHPMPGGRQRSWPKNMKPSDLAEQEKRIRYEIKKQNLDVKK